MRWLLVVLSLLFAGGCQDSELGKFIDEKFPPVSVDGQREAGQQSAIAALSQISQPNLAFGLKLTETKKVLLTEDLRKSDVKDTRLKSSEQILSIEVDFDHEFTGDEFQGSGSDLLRKLHPSVAGTLVFHSSVATGLQTAAGGDSYISVKLLPALGDVSITKVAVAGDFEVPLLGTAISKAIELFAENISGVIARLPIMEVSVPTNFVDKANPSKTIQIENDSVKGQLTLNGNDVGVPLRLRAVAFSLDADSIVALAQFVPVDAPDGTAEATAETHEPPDSIRKHFEQVLSSNFGIEEAPAPVWAAVRKDMVSAGINSVMDQAQLCFSAVADIGRQDFSQKISFPDETTIDCTSSRDCTPTRDCGGISRSHDTTSCRACIWTQCPTWRRPFRQCEQCGNNPVCEAAKAAQNFAYDADYNARVLDCERIKTQNKRTCEAEKAGQKTLCEAGKEIMKRIARTGNFANVDIGVSGNANLNACISKFVLASNLRALSATLDLEGGADVDLSLKFVPLGIIGHLTCQVPWTENQRFKAEVRRQTVALESALTFVEGSSGYKFETKETSVDFAIKPWPSEFLLTSVNMNLSCSGMGLVRPLIIPATAFVPELRGDFTHEVGPMSFTASVDLPRARVFDHELIFTVSETDTAVLLNAAAMEAD